MFLELQTPWKPFGNKPLNYQKAIVVSQSFVRPLLSGHNQAILIYCAVPRDDDGLMTTAWWWQPDKYSLMTTDWRRRPDDNAWRRRPNDNDGLMTTTWQQTVDDGLTTIAWRRDDGLTKTTWRRPDDGPTIAWRWPEHGWVKPKKPRCNLMKTKTKFDWDVSMNVTSLSNTYPDSRISYIMDGVCPEAYGGMIDFLSHNNKC